MGALWQVWVGCGFGPNDGMDFMPAWGASFSSSSDGVASARLFVPLAFLLAPVPQLREWLHGCVYGCPWPIFRRPPHRVPLPVISVLAVLSV